MHKSKLLIIDNDSVTADLLKGFGEDYAYETQIINNINDFKEIYGTFKPSLIILDLSLSDGDGIELLRFLGQQQCRASIIIMSHHEEKIRFTAYRFGASQGLNMVDTLQKPFELGEVKRIFDKIKTDYSDPSVIQLEQAIKEYHFVLHYQPKISIKDKKIEGVEVLVRWRPDTNQLIFPGNFIQLAEESGLIKPLTHWIIEKSFEQYVKWKSNNQHFSMAINLSPHLINNLNLPDEIEALAQQYAVDRDKICFEITETGIMGHPEIAMDILTRLRLKGFSLSIDDFGTGYSSLIQLYRMPFNELKIDRSFIMNLEKDQEARTITRSIIDLAHNLGLKVVAEGVESKQIWKDLEALGCDYAQGYYMSKPLSLESFPEWLAQYHAKQLPWME